jgi:hypothetical protein
MQMDLERLLSIRRTGDRATRTIVPPRPLDRGGTVQSLDYGSQPGRPRPGRSIEYRDVGPRPATPAGHPGPDRPGPGPPRSPSGPGSRGPGAPDGPPGTGPGESLQFVGSDACPRNHRLGAVGTLNSRCPSNGHDQVPCPTVMLRDIWRTLTPFFPHFSPQTSACGIDPRNIIGRLTRATRENRR